MNGTVIVICKEPVPGRVKTRMCPPLSARQAASLARAAITDTLSAVKDCACTRRVVALDGDPEGLVDESFEVIDQRGDDLAERLANAFADIGGPALLIGMDTPQLSARQLDDALGHTLEAGSALGPASDGGYWAIGLRRPDEQVFCGVRMSRPGTGMAQLKRMQALGLRPVLLDELTDFDTIATARAVAARAPESEFAAALAAVDREAATT